MMDFVSILLESFLLPITYFVSPDKRLFIGYLLTSACLAYWVFKRQSRTGFLQYLFPRDVWLGPSARLDYQLVFFNAVVKVVFLGQLFIYGLHLAFYVNDFLVIQFGAKHEPWSPMWVYVLFAVTSTLIGDGTVYVVHRAFHRIPFLWAIHKVHHSATVLNPVTQFRIHPLELIVNNVRATLVFGSLAGAMDYLSGGQTSPMALVGVNLFSIAFFAFGANLRHSHVRLSYWHWLEHLLISPTQHQIHHSVAPAHHNRNFGSKLAIWDLMFGTLQTSQHVGAITVGLNDGVQRNQTLWSMLRFTVRPHPRHPSQRVRRS